MKIKVDAMPKIPYECIFHKRTTNYWGHSTYVCTCDPEETPCRLSKPGGGKCPHLLCDNNDSIEIESKKESVCDHDWIGYGYTTITHQAPTIPIGSYEYCICEKCGQHNLKAIITDETGRVVRRY